MKHAPILFCLGILMVSAAPVLAKPAYVASTVNLRAAPGTTSEIVGKIPGGSLIDAKDCSEGWCAVTWQEKSGFAIQTALDLSGHVPRRARGAGLSAPFALCRGGRTGVRRAAAAGLLLWPLPAVLGLAPALVVNAAGPAARHVTLSPAPQSRPSPTLTAR